MFINYLEHGPECTGAGGVSGTPDGYVAISEPPQLPGQMSQQQGHEEGRAGVLCLGRNNPIHQHKLGANQLGSSSAKTLQRREWTTWSLSSNVPLWQRQSAATCFVLERVLPGGWESWSLSFTQHWWSHWVLGTVLEPPVQERHGDRWSKPVYRLWGWLRVTWGKNESWDSSAWGKGSHLILSIKKMETDSSQWYQPKVKTHEVLFNHLKKKIYKETPYFQCERD